MVTSVVATSERSIPQVFYDQRFPVGFEICQRHAVDLLPSLARTGIGLQRHERRQRVERAQLLQPMRLDQELRERASDRIDAHLSAGVLSIKIASDVKDQGM